MLGHSQQTNQNISSIAIITTWGNGTGMGHLQRMAALLWYLNEHKRVTSYLISKTLPESFPPELMPFVKPEIDTKPDIIIHDKRDSSAGEIINLKKISKVITIDDNGKGRKKADYAIDLLPNPEIYDTKTDFNKNDLFLYGYNFLKSVAGIGDNIITKNLDFALYPGNSATNEYIDFLISLLPKKVSYAIINEKYSYISKEENIQKFDKNQCANIILSSKIIISHFGITLYEGAIAQSRLISINPTSYHSKLSDIETETLGISNLGVFNNINRESASIKINEILQSACNFSISAKQVYQKALSNLDNFYLFLKTIAQRLLV